MEDQARDYDTMVSRVEIRMTMRISRDIGREAKEIILESTIALAATRHRWHRHLRFYEVVYKVRHTCA